MPGLEKLPMADGVHMTRIAGHDRSDEAEALASAHLRVAQSVAVVRQLPMVVFGNGFGALIGAHAIAPTFGWPLCLPMVIGMWILLLPVLRSRTKLQRREVPPRVSERRVRSLTRYSGALGVFWGVCIVSYLPVSPFEVQAFLLTGCAFLAAGSAAAFYVIPRACLAYSAPIFATGLWVIFTSQHPSHIALGLLLVLMCVGVSYMLYANWANFKSTVQLTAEKAFLLDQAQSAAAVKNQFMENVSHEVRAPLTSIVGYAQLLAAESDGIGHAQRRYIDHIVQHTRQLTALAENMLDISRLDAGQVIIAPSAFDPRELFDTLAARFSGPASAKGVEISWSLAPTVPAMIDADSVRIMQVLACLVDNAIKFTSHGSVAIELSWTASTSSAQAMLRLKVSDTGIGIRLADQPRVFERFWQLDGTTRRIHGGAGLGLAICKELVLLMKGSMNIMSQIGSGSSFEILLPCKAADTGTTGIAEIQKILVVDDDIFIGKLIREFLKGGTWEVDVVTSGQEAVARCLDVTFDAIFMDIQMPGMDGMDATRAIRSSGASQDARIVAVTAYLSKDRVTALLARGFNDYLGKPITRDAVLAKLRAPAM